MTLGQPQTSLVPNQVAMKVGWYGKAEGADEEQLPGSRFQQVGATDDFGNLHRSVVRHHGELVSGNIIAPPNHEVAKILPGDESLLALTWVIQCDGLAFGNKESPIHALRRFIVRGLADLRTAIPRIEWLIVGFIRSSG